MQVTVILVRPEVAGNVGAIARVMGNFGVEHLTLVDPKCDHLSKESQDRAKHNKKLLKNAKVVASLDDIHHGTLVATTGQIGTDFNLPRSPLLPKQLAQAIPAGADVGLIFGPEGPGLSNKEIMRCDITCTVPTDKAYSSMNLSHAVAVILYELYAGADDHIVSHIRPAGEPEKKQLLKMADAIIEQVEWGTPYKAETQRRVWRKVVGKAFLSKREAFALMGFLRKLKPAYRK